jgi:subtilisin
MAETKANSGPKETLVDKGHQRYLIAPRRSKLAASIGLQPMSAGGMKSAISNLERIANCKVVRVIKPRRKLATLSAADEARETYVVSMDEEYAQVIKQSAPPNMIVEEDAYLSYGNYGAIPLAPLRIQPRVGNLKSTAGIEGKDIKIRIVGENNVPIPNARVMLEGDGFPGEGQTDKKGELVLKLFTLPGGRARSLFIDPHRDYWTRYMTSPPLSTSDVNVIKLQSLKETVPGFAERYKFGWGQRMMGLDQLPDEYTGKGVKIAIIDSGADNKHPILQHIKNGVDLTNDENTSTWADDTVGHGTHCSGVITGKSAAGIALRGFAPEAEIHIFKVFPGGQFSSLLDAIDHCIDLEVDVVNMSLGSPQVSEAVEQKLEEAVESGVACIVAAGNSGGPVQYPARSPNVLAVAAIGKLDEFPQKTWDSQTVVPGLIGQDGIFSPQFTCFGPEIAVCAPGVAIISSVPDKAFDAESGTSMAAPHVTGFAALLLAHHPVFKNGPFSQRSAQRVAGLFNLIKTSCAPYNFGPGRTGAGVPMLHGLVQAVQAPPAAIAQQPAGAAGQVPQQPVAAAPSQGVGAGQAAVTSSPQDLLASQLGQALLSGNLANLMALGQLGGMGGAGMMSPQIAQLLAGGVDLNRLMEMIALARAQGLIR